MKAKTMTVTVNEKTMNNIDRLSERLSKEIGIKFRKGSTVEFAINNLMQMYAK